MKKLKIVFITVFITLILAALVFTIFIYRDKQSELDVFSGVDSTASKLVSSTRIIEAADRFTLNEDISRSRKNIITHTVEEVSPAVVGINVMEIQKFRSPMADIFGNDPYFRDFFPTYEKKIPGLGSGCLISSDGYILTNDHVAGNAVEIVVTMTDGNQYDAEIVGSDQASDICLLKIDAENLPFIRMGNSNEMIIGEWVIALGNPFGLFNINDKPSVTVGVISSTGMNLGEIRSRYYIDMIQTDASINGGNSGGPLVNSLGELIGMNTLIYTSGRSSGSVGVGFAIPSNKIKKIIKDLKQSGSIDRNFWTGLVVQPIDQAIARYYKLKNTRGVIVTHVAEDSPGESAGIKVGDLILKVDRFNIENDSELIAVLHEYNVDEVLELEIQRDNEIMKKELKLERRND